MALKADPTTPQIAKKAAVIDEISAKLREADAAVLTEYRGLTVTQIAELRAVLRPAGAEYKIYKNTLVRRAAGDAGFGEQLEALLTGPVAVAFVRGDAAGAAKALRDFARTTPALVLKGGVLGERTLSTADVDALAELPRASSCSRRSRACSRRRSPRPPASSRPCCATPWGWWAPSSTSKATKSPQARPGNRSRSPRRPAPVPRRPEQPPNPTNRS